MERIKEQFEKFLDTEENRLKESFFTFMPGGGYAESRLKTQYSTGAESYHTGSEGTYTDTIGKHIQSQPGLELSIEINETGSVEAEEKRVNRKNVQTYLVTPSTSLTIGSRDLILENFSTGSIICDKNSWYLLLEDENLGVRGRLFRLVGITSCEFQ